ncbi:MAG: DNA mismatch repair endonuclease MutL, partial [Desulfobacterales bacterium]|nr:DNA mismatch repair endonuclease MutL [Desulfobacterales bacterium]
AQPGIRIRVDAGSRSLMNIPAVKDIAERISLTLGRDFRGQLLPVAGEKGGAKLNGYVSRPEFTRSNASQIYLYVNGRFVKDYLLNHAVMTAFRRIIEPRRYPAAVLFLEAPPGDVDVNVHPTKMEVRFRNPREIYALIVETLGGAIGAGVQTAGPGGNRPDRTTVAYAARCEEALKRYRISSGTEKLFFGRPSPPQTPVGPSWTATVDEISRHGQTAAATAPMETSDGAWCFADLVYLGQVDRTYLVFSGAQGLVLVDQHAAHERILFEGLKRSAERDGQRTPGQRLLMPEVVSLPPRDLLFLKESIPILEEAGIEVEAFGGDSVVLKAVPAFLSDA